MTWIIILLLLGIALFMVEVFFVPGTTIVGILGVIIAGVGVYMAYTEFGPIAGNIILGISSVALVIFIAIGAKNNVWSRFSIQDDLVNSKVNVIEIDSIKIGDKGKAMSSIRPMGKARINGKSFEVRSLGVFIDPGTKVVVIKIDGNKITVKPAEETKKDSEEIKEVVSK
jgi:membrane-bound ClpP family serine protease